MSEQDSVSAAALVIALIALLVTSLQLLQAVFGSVEGYRKCNYDSISLWSRYRRRKFRPMELRMELLFQTPEFAMGETHFEDAAIDDPVPKTSRKGIAAWRSLMFKDRGNETESPRVIDGAQSSAEQTNVPTELVRGRRKPGRNVGWMQFLVQLHQHERRYEDAMVTFEKDNPVDYGRLHVRPWLKPTIRSGTFFEPFS